MRFIERLPISMLRSLFLSANVPAKARGSPRRVEPIAMQNYPDY